MMLPPDGQIFSGACVPVMAGLNNRTKHHVNNSTVQPGCCMAVTGSVSGLAKAEQEAI